MQDSFVKVRILPEKNVLNWKKTDKQKQILIILKTVCKKVIMKQKAESLSRGGPIEDWNSMETRKSL